MNNGKTVETMTYKTWEVAKATGVTLRQLQWWDEQKIIMPRHDGHMRLYSEREFLQVRLLAALRSQGVSLQQARRILKCAPSAQSTERIFFVTDGRKTFSGTDAEQAIRAILGMRRARLAICEVPATLKQE